MCNPAHNQRQVAKCSKSREKYEHKTAENNEVKRMPKITNPFFFAHFYFPASGQQAVVTGVVPSPPGSCLHFFIAHRVQQSHCSSIFHLVVLLTHTLAFYASQFVRKKTPHEFIRVCTRRGSKKLTHTRLEDNLIRHRGDRLNPN